MADTKMDDFIMTRQLIIHAETLYSVEYQASIKEINMIAPMNLDESAFEYAMRITMSSRNDIFISAALEVAWSHGRSFIRKLFKFTRTMNDHERSSEIYGLYRNYFDISGLAQLLNVFIMLFPYEVLRWCCRPPQQPFPKTFAKLFPVAHGDLLIMRSWMYMISPEAKRSTKPFNKLLIEALLAMVS